MEPLILTFSDLGNIKQATAFPLLQSSQGILIIQTYCTCPSDPGEYSVVHVSQGNEGQHPSGEGWVPQQGQGVPEYEGWVFSGLTRINLIGSIVFSNYHLHELGDVEDEGQDSDRHDVDQDTHVAGQPLKLIGCRIQILVAVFCFVET